LIRIAGFIQNAESDFPDPIQPGRVCPHGASRGWDENCRGFAEIEPIDDIGQIEGPASAVLAGRDEPQQGDGPRNVGDAGG
jgi:hypothetical protein